MIKKFTFLLIFGCTLFGYDALLLESQLSILPKIAALDKDLSKKMIDGKVVIAVVFESGDFEAAKDAAAQLSRMTSGGFEVKGVAVEYQNLSKIDASVYFLMPSSEQNLKKATQLAKQKRIISFVHEKEMLSLGAMLSMSIERSTMIIIKRSVVRESGVQFLDSFFKIAKVIE